MTPSLVMLLLAGAAPDGPTASPPSESALEAHRMSLDALAEHMLGSASRAVRFDWRRKLLGVGVLGSQLLELNNFNSARAGLFARMPVGDWMLELGFSRVFVWGSDSTAKLALTPYRQVGRPSRFELDFNVGYPVAEGVMTPRLSFLPAAELVLSLYAGLRYAFYADALRGATAGEVASAVLAPKLTSRELTNMEPLRLPGMALDNNRYMLLGGLSLDVYFRPGFFIAPRVMAALPIFSIGSSGDLKWWWELNLAVGWML